MDISLTIIDKTYEFTLTLITSLEEGSDTPKEFGEKLAVIKTAIENIEKNVYPQIYMVYQEFFQSFNVFLGHCENEDFLVDNVDNVMESLGLFAECLEDMKKQIKDKVKVCPCCQKKVIYEPIDPYYRQMQKRYGVTKFSVPETLNEKEYFCPSCRASDRDRMIISFMKKANFEKAKEGRNLLHIAPAKTIENWILTKCPQINYYTTDLFMDNVDIKSDVQDLKEIKDKSMDFIICSHVLEHVQSDEAAMKAMKRVLKDDGAIIFLVPIDLSVNEIDEEWGCSEEENWRRFGQGDHCRKYSKEGLVERLNKYFYVHQLGKNYFTDDEFFNCALTDTSILYVLTKDEKVNIDFEEKMKVSPSLCENGPKVSVIMSAYNHEKYVEEAILSVINQSYKNIEFIVGDDCSKDGTADVMRKYSQYFAKEVYSEKNIGGMARSLRKYATGKYVAIMNSDDVWDLDKIALQVEYMEKHEECGACLTWCKYTDEHLNELEDDIFIQPNRNRDQWMRYFWKYGNALCFPSSLIRAEYSYAGLYYGSVCRQIPDFFNWVDLVQKTDIYVLPRVLIKMRRYNKAVLENTSASNKINNSRYAVENGINWLNVIKYMDNEFFKKTFGEYFVKKDAATDEELKCEKYFLMLNSNNIFIQHDALVYFNEEYKDIKETMENTYDYSRRRFWEDEINKGFGRIIN